jgi:predicted transcriptional regulator
MTNLSLKTKLALRDQFKAARVYALADAEGFQEILYSLERLGIILTKQVLDLYGYGNKIKELARESPLAFEIPQTYRHFHTPFDTLYEIVRNARNDALHQGAYARHLTSHAIELSLILEDSLSGHDSKENEKFVADYMVKDVVQAEPWQPISYVRQVMLSNNFSFLPIFKDDWHFVSDMSLAKALIGKSNNKRKEVLALTLEEAIKNGIVKLLAATQIDYLTPFNLLSDKLEHYPLLVMRDKNLVGIITSFDVM